MVPRGAAGLETGVLMTRRGFTLIEVMIALVILAVVVLATAQLTTTMVHTVVTSQQQDAAVELAQSRLAQIRADPGYAGLEGTYVATETTFPTLPGFSRRTQILHIGGVGLPLDYKRITVTVNGPGLLVPVTRSVTVAAP
jgi:prepilin-type N-terminal cleavage/methylation domain-containing protein